ncbi:MAG: hypothetical protein NTZ34_06160, partial [Chloroflexi bacterium]|nr:hypothetical protein [Chloroflexota bacterium]
STRIGHFAGNTEVYLCERDAGINVPHRRFVDVWYQMPFVYNTQLNKLWDRTRGLHIVQLVSVLDRLNRLPCFYRGRLQSEMIPLFAGIPPTR